jgi:hypothetical protein
MRTKRFRVTLTPEERGELQQLIGSGKAPARKLAHARILLKADTAPGEHGAFDDDIAAAVEVSVATVERVRRRFVEEGLAAALVPKPSTAAHVTKLDGRGKRGCWRPSPVPRPRASAAGRCACWPATWSNWPWWSPSRARRCAAF